MVFYPAQGYIQKLNFTPHPEGGYYKEIYRLESGDFSSLHKLNSDEQWFHIDGSALTIYSKGNYSKYHIGKNLDAGELPCAIVPYGNWFGGTVDDANSFSLVGCVVSPAFDFADFELAKKDQLIKRFRQHGGLIERLTRKYVNLSLLSLLFWYTTFSLPH